MRSIIQRAHFQSLLEGVLEASVWFEFAFDFKKAIVFRDPFATADGSGFDLTTAHCNCEIRHEGVFGLAGTVADHETPACSPAQFDGFDCFGDGSNLIELDKYRIRSAFPDTAGNKTGVGDINVVADNLNAFAQSSGMAAKTIPVIFC